MLIGAYIAGDVKISGLHGHSELALAQTAVIIYVIYLRRMSAPHNSEHYTLIIIED